MNMRSGFRGGALRRALRGIALPVPVADAEAVEASAATKLQSLGVAEENHAAWLAMEIEDWRATKNPSRQLRAVLQAAIKAGGPSPLAQTLARNYWTAHRDLISTENEYGGLSFDEATTLLSHSLQIAHLIQVGRMSASQIASVVSSQHASMRFVSKSVEKVVSKLSPALSPGRPRLTNALRDRVWQEDAEAELLDFGDADEATSITIVAEVAHELGFRDDMAGLLGQFRTPTSRGGLVGPYFAMLYFLCLVPEVADHPLTVPYEFSPRGAANVRFLVEKFAVVDPGTDPFLNNAKAVYALDFTWASTRTTPYQARALVRVLQGLEDMGYSARTELAAWLRKWIQRVLRLEAPPQAILDELSREQIDLLLSHAIAKETNTGGVIEQRIVDTVASMLHAEGDWHARGLGDSVNASNTSRMKLGDVEFESLKARKVMAYEAHAGELSSFYVDAHKASLERTARARSESWPIEAGQPNWMVESTFVGHSADSSVLQRFPEELTIEVAGHGALDVRLEFCKLDQLLTPIRTKGDDELIQSFSRSFTGPMNERRTPNEYRRICQSIISGQNPTVVAPE